MAAILAPWREGTKFGVKICVFVILLFYFFPVLNGEKTIGPYDIFVGHFEECEDAGTGEIQIWIEGKNGVKGKPIFEGNISLKVPLDDNLVLSIDASQLRKDGVKKSLYKKDFVRACYTFGIFLPKLRKDIFNSAGLADRCPAPKGFYTIKNIVFRDTVTQIPVFFYGKYKSEIVIKRNNKKLGCTNLYIDVVPKKKGRKRT